jgi:tetratricopeptide (TPR) repeat protein
VFTGDHGESLGEHGESTHGFFIYDATILVPLVVHYPGRVVPRRIDASVRLVDVAATALDLAGAKDALGGDGTSFVPILDGRAAGPRPAYCESQQPFIAYGWSPLRAMRDGGFKLIDAPRPELYDLSLDPGEGTNRAAALPAEVERLRHLLGGIERTGGVAASSVADAESTERLRALGYIGGGASAPRPEERPSLADPKDCLVTKARLAEADAALDRGETAAGAAAFQGILAKEPDNRFALLRGGTALVRLGRLAAAIRLLERAVALDATQAEALYALAEALSLAGDDAGAIRRWREMVRLQPRRAVAWSNLGAVLLRARDDRGALDALEHAAELSPGNEAILENLSEVQMIRAASEASQGRLEEASELLAKATRGRPQLRLRAQRDRRLAPLLR